MVMWRELLGAELRATRIAQKRTLRDVAATASVALGYLSELERGRKEASSELLSSICQALDVTMSQVLRRVAEAAERQERVVSPLPIKRTDSDVQAA